MALSHAPADLEYKLVLCVGGSEVAEWQPGSNRRVNLTTYAPQGGKVSITHDWDTHSMQVVMLNKVSRPSAPKSKPSPRASLVRGVSESWRDD